MKRFRAPLAIGLVPISMLEANSTAVARPPVDREAGIIYGVAVIQVGEATGHGMRIDQATIAQVAELGAAAPLGIKSRFTHPGMCGDGMGKQLGRVKNFRVVGDRVVGDLHFGDYAAKSPGGNLRDYVLSLAEEDPASFGMSIGFEGTTAWKLADGSEIEADNGLDGGPVPPGATTDQPFARVFDLFAVDVVDEPAATDGLFADERLAAAFSSTSNELAAEAFARIDALLADLHIDQAKAQSFAARYFAARSLSLPAGAKPAHRPQQAHEKDSAMFDKKRLAELRKAHPSHKDLITDCFERDLDEPATMAEVGRAELASRDARIVELSAGIDAAKTAHAADVLALKAAHATEIAALSAKLASAEELAGIAKHAPVDPGSDDKGTPPAAPSMDQLASGRLDNAALAKALKAPLA